MRLIRIVLTSFSAAALFAGSVMAQAPAGSTGECKDGSYTSNATKKGACSRHGGVKDWYEGKTSVQTEKEGASSPSAKTDKPAATPSTAVPPSSSAKSSKTSAMPSTPAAGGGAGKVWVNTSSNVYHCEKDKWYGKTKKGEYMSEAEAKAKGAHAEHNKACS